MPFYFTPYIILPLLSAFVNAAVALFSLQRRHVPAALPLFWITFGMSGWSLSHALNTAATTLALKVFFLQAIATFVGIIVPSMLALALETVGLRSWLTRPRLLAASALPAALVLLIWTCGLQRLHTFTLYTRGSLLLLGYASGPVIVVFTTFARLMILAALGLYISGFRRMPRSEWFRFVLLIVATIVPLTIGYLSGPPGESFNFSTSVLFVSGVCYAQAIFRHRLLDLMPLARTVLFDQIGEPVLVFNDRGELVDCNHAARKLTVEGADADIKAVQEAVQARFPQWCAEGGGSPAFDSIDYIADGLAAGRGWRVAASPLNAGVIRGTLVLLHDITDLKDTERRLKDSKQRLRELNSGLQERVEEETRLRVAQERLLANQSRLAAMGEMIAAIAHQWRQPLNTLGLIVQRTHAVGSMQTLNQEQLDEFKANAMRQIRHMSETIEEFHGFYRQDKQKELFCPFACVSDCVRLFDHQFSGNGVRVEIRRQGSAGAAVPRIVSCSRPDLNHDHCDGSLGNGFPNELKQVLLNLMGNARDSILASRSAGNGPEEGLIDVFISTSEENGGIAIDITDNGGGIPADIAPRIFDPYFTTKEGSGGTGIGLYMSRMIVQDSLGGSLRLLQGHRGAVFRIELPPSVLSNYCES